MESENSALIVVPESVRSPEFVPERFDADSVDAKTPAPASEIVQLEFWTSFPVVPSKRTIALSVALDGPTTKVAAHVRRYEISFCRMFMSVAVTSEPRPRNGIEYESPVSDEWNATSPDTKSMPTCPLPWVPSRTSVRAAPPTVIVVPYCASGPKSSSTLYGDAGTVPVSVRS